MLTSQLSKHHQQQVYCKHCRRLTFMFIKRCEQNGPAVVSAVNGPAVVCVNGPAVVCTVNAELRLRSRSQCGLISLLRSSTVDEYTSQFSWTGGVSHFVSSHSFLLGVTVIRWRSVGITAMCLAITPRTRFCRARLTGQYSPLLRHFAPVH